MIYIFMIKNRGQNVHIYVFIINKRQFLAACTLHRTLRVLMHIAHQINESFALAALHGLNAKERKTRVGKK